MSYTTPTQQGNVTLSYFSRSIDSSEIPMDRNHVRLALVDSLRKLLSSVEITRLNERGRLNHYLIPKDKKQDTIENWGIKINFLDNRNNRDSSFYLVSYRILITFHPEVKEKYRNDPTYSKAILEDSLGILHYIPENFSLGAGNVDLTFSRLDLDREIDVNSWKVIVGADQTWTISQLISKKLDAIKVIDAVSRTGTSFRPIVGYFMDDISDKMKEAVKRYFGYSGMQFNANLLNGSTLAYDISSGKIGTNPVVFGNYPHNRAGEYSKWKVALTKNNIPSQNLEDIPADQSSEFAKMQTMKLEVYHKIGYRPLELDPGEETGDQDGFLYLCRFTELMSKEEKDHEKYKDLLGSVVIYGKRFGESEGLVMTIVDPVKETKLTDENVDGLDDQILVKNPESVSEILSKGIRLKGMKLDLILTRKPQLEQLQQLIQYLKTNDIEIRKVFFFSTKYSCGPSDPERIELGSTDTVSYKILHGKHLFYQPSQRVLGQFDIGTAYCELLLPSNEVITEKDVVSIVRLAKRRLYRIYNIPSLRIPEPIVIFKVKHEIIAEVGSSGNYMPLRLFI
jgi:hypothetical protein